MNVPDIIIAIDGYSSTGKSSFAKQIAKEFSFLYLDSGAMYRCVTLVAMKGGMIDESGAIDVPALESAMASGIDIHFRNMDGISKAFIGDVCVEDEIRTLEVSSHVSPVAAIASVRAFVDEKLHAFSKGGRVVMDGRDIGTTVFPDAELKLFMTANDKVRAQRRYDELVSKGIKADFDEVLANLKERDYIDSHREVSPLTQAPDAIVLDNSEMTPLQQMEWVKDIVSKKFPC